MPISDVTDITITLAAPFIASDAFGNILITGSSTALADNSVETYSTLEEMLDAGFVTSDTEYKAAQAILSQELKPSSFKVGSLGAKVAQLDTVTVATAATGTYTITITPLGQPPVAHSVVYVAQTAEQISEELVVLLEAGAYGSILTVLDDAAAGVITIQATVPGQSFTTAVSSGSPANMTLAHTTANTGYQELLAALSADDSNWYALYNSADHTKAHILESAAYIESSALRRIFLAQSAEAAVLTDVATDTASLLETAAYARTSLWYHDDDTEHLAAALAGTRLAVDVDKESPTWAHVALASIPVDTLTTSQQTILEGKNANFYVNLNSAGSTWQGKMADGTWIDDIVSMDWLNARLHEAHVNRFQKVANAGKKVPYTNAGIGIIRADAAGVFNVGVKINRFLSYTLTFPLRADVSGADVSARKLSYSASAILAGAIHKLSITANLE